MQIYCSISTILLALCFASTYIYCYITYI